MEIVAVGKEIKTSFGSSPDDGWTWVKPVEAQTSAELLREQNT